MTPQTPDEIALPELPKGHYVRAVGEMYSLGETQAYAREHEKNVRAALTSRAVTDERAAFDAARQSEDAAHEAVGEITEHHKARGEFVKSVAFIGAELPIGTILYAARKPS
jgi:hypothetical protein